MPVFYLFIRWYILKGDPLHKPSRLPWAPLPYRFFLNFMHISNLIKIFRFPKPRIPDSASKIYPDFEFAFPRLSESGWGNIKILCVTVTPQSSQKQIDRDLRLRLQRVIYVCFETRLALLIVCIYSDASDHNENHYKTKAGLIGQLWMGFICPIFQLDKTNLH